GYRHIAGRRSGAVRLRARLQLLHVGRHAHLSRKRKVHGPAKGDVQHLPTAVSGADDVDQTLCIRQRHCAGSSREDGEDRCQLQVQRQQDQGRGKFVHRSLPREDGTRPRSYCRNVGSRHTLCRRDSSARRDFHHRAGDADSRRTSRIPARGHAADHEDGICEHVGIRTRRSCRHREADGAARPERCRAQASSGKINGQDRRVWYFHELTSNIEQALTLIKNISNGITISVVAAGLLGAVVATTVVRRQKPDAPTSPDTHATVHRAVAHDVSGVLSAENYRPSRLDASGDPDDVPRNALAPDPDGVREMADTTIVVAPIVIPKGGEKVEQHRQGSRSAPVLFASFGGLGADFVGPQGNAVMRSPADNSLAVGRDYIVQLVNSRMAIYTKKGALFDTTGKVLYGPVETNNIFKGFGGACESHNNGDAVVRYDQLADRWLVVMPIFTRLPRRPVEPVAPKAGDPADLSQKGQPGQPGKAAELYQPPQAHPTQLPAENPQGRRPGTRPPADSGGYAMCYAVSTTSSPFGPYYRYEFARPLFPDYPRPAIWPDGYYVPTSTGDAVIQKHACVADRARMLKGEDATEQCMIVDGVNFLNNADVDGTQTPPAGAPNIVIAAGGTQLKKVMEDDGIYIWKYHVDWNDPSRTTLTGPQKIAVAPYHYLCDGQLTSCVPQPGTDRRLDAQGDKLMARVVYRRIGNQQSIVATHSVNTSLGGGGVRWYEFRIGNKDDVSLFQQGTYAPDSSFR